MGAKRKASKKTWNIQEDQHIVRLVQELGCKRWALLAKKMQELGHSRTGKQCRERWHNHLDSSIKKGPWSKEEEELLEFAHRQFGNQWSKISGLFEGRTDNAIKNHWFAKMRREKRRSMKRKHANGGIHDMDHDDVDVLHDADDPHPHLRHGHHDHHDHHEYDHVDTPPRIKLLKTSNPTESPINNVISPKQENILPHTTMLPSLKSTEISSYMWNYYGIPWRGMKGDNPEVSYDHSSNSGGMHVVHHGEDNVPHVTSGSHGDMSKTFEEISVHLDEHSVVDISELDWPDEIIV